MSQCWRDLRVGEKICAGDRYISQSGNWLWVAETETDCYVTDQSPAMQRLVDYSAPLEQGRNRYGLDVGYFRKTIDRELNRGLTDYKPDELARVLARLSVTADNRVLFEEEFQSRRGL